MIEITFEALLAFATVAFVVFVIWTWNPSPEEKRQREGAKAKGFQPHYMGRGETLWRCPQCCALVDVEDCAEHKAWHPGISE